jgi:hypothetical protein
MTSLDPINQTQIALATLLGATTAVTALLAAGASGIHFPVAPADRTWPYLLLECLDAPERDRTFGGPTWTAQKWKLSAVTIEDAPLASTIAAEVNAVLEGATLSITGFTNLCCMRTRAIPPLPVQGTDGVLRFHAGGEYEIGVGT